MTTAEAYVTAAFLVVLAVVLLWLVIYAFKMRRLESEVRELERDRPIERVEAAEPPRVVPGPAADPAAGGQPDGAPRDGAPAGTASRTAEPV
jgi:hypothetical protein